MSSDTGVRQKISDYVTGELDAFDLEDWISTVVWDAPPSEERQLGYDALRLLAEASNGEWTDGELRVQLAKLCGMLPYGDRSTSGESPSLMSEGFLEKLSAAEEKRKQRASADEARLAALMCFAGAKAEASSPQWSETVQPSGPGFLDRPKGENETPDSAPAELAIG